MSETIMEIRGVRKEFLRRGKDQVRAFNAVADASLKLHAGDFIACVGRSGSGKTTLLNMMAGLLPPTEGAVLLEGKDLYSWGDSELSRLRNATIGVVPQGQTGIGSLTLIENVMLPWRMYRADGDIEQEAHALLKELGIASLADSYPAELSGGELRRMSIARARVQAEVAVDRRADGRS